MGIELPGLELPRPGTPTHFNKIKGLTFYLPSLPGLPWRAHLIRGVISAHRQTPGKTSVKPVAKCPDSAKVEPSAGDMGRSHAARS
jgi:hypothetical protein